MLILVGVMDDTDVLAGGALIKFLLTAHLMPNHLNFLINIRLNRGVILLKSRLSLILMVIHIRLLHRCETINLPTRKTWLII